jgi:hypothetical protein
MLHALQSDQPAGEFLHARRLAMDDEDFQAGIMIEMCVAG